MRNENIPRRHHLLANAVFVVALLVMPILANAQDNTARRAEQQKLVEAQTENYKAQTAKINEERSWWQRIIGLGTFFAAVVALMSFLLNYFATLQTQKDTQFYEALKRFGDKDSATMRSSAAGTIAEMVRTKPGPIRRLLLGRSRRYLDTALNQLVAGLLLEDNSVSLASVGDAIEHLIEVAPLEVLAKLTEANVRLQNDITEHLARYFASIVDDGILALFSDDHWNEVSAATPYEEEVIHSLASRHDDQFRKLFKTAFHEIGQLTAAKKLLAQVDALRGLKLSSERLSTNVRILSSVLRNDPFKDFHSAVDIQPDLVGNPKSPVMNLSAVFLTKANLEDAKLQGVSLQGAQLQQARLWRANLQQAFLQQTNLQGARLDSSDLRRSQLFQANFAALPLKNEKGEVYYLDRTHLAATHLEEANLAAASFEGADLPGTRIARASIDKNTNFENASWWMADFSDDTKLLGQVFERYKDAVPANLEACSATVKSFVLSKGQIKADPPQG